ncbi:MAG: hypothetical protein CYPHOPRED_001045, partial [Cyphobasidiales sp. Tagirdzhanova-0007]
MGEITVNSAYDPCLHATRAALSFGSSSSGAKLVTLRLPSTKTAHRKSEDMHVHRRAGGQNQPQTNLKRLHNRSLTRHKSFIINTYAYSKVVYLDRFHFAPTAEIGQKRGDRKRLIIPYIIISDTSIEQLEDDI